MFLKSLTLKGFKSFADPTTLHLEPGVTVVVGPNGSGKSNVVDAIAWVLGAQAPRSVRSQKMDDVIFAGTETRPALGRAEVSLTIDNSSKLLPVDLEEVTITRTLFRSGDSEYSINQVPCRLLDIQELLSDSGVGRQQHVIVSQGQIDAVLNARPEERRAIIEEAAGVLKFRKRKERSERRLHATEANLTRLQDLLREVRRQLRPLERQADAARRHGALVDELGTLRLFTAGREIAELRVRADTNRGRQTEAKRDESELVAALARLDVQVLAAESRLAESGGEDLGEALTRFESMRERARGLAAVLDERLRGIERERTATVDRDVVSSLEAEAVKLEAELREVDEQAAHLVPDAGRLETAEAELEAEQRRFDEEWADGAPTPSGAAAEVRGELSALQQAIRRAEAEHDRRQARRTELEAIAGHLRAERERLDTERMAATAADDTCRADSEGAEQRRARAEEVVERSEERRVRAEREREAWTARSDALALALDEARASSGFDELDDLDGVIGTLLEVVEIDEGWEAAFEAAAGEAVAAVVVTDAAVGRRAVEILRDGDAAGAVLALGVSAPAARVPTGGSAIRSHVRSAEPGVDSLLDRLVGATVVVADWADAVDLALADPTATVVTRDGGRFGTSGWRVGAPRTGATGAALEEAISHAESAIAEVDEARAALDIDLAELDDARRAEADLAEVGRVNQRTLVSATESLRSADRELRDATVELDGLERHITEIGERLERDRVRSNELSKILPDLEADDADRVEKGRQLSLFRTRLEARAAAVAALRTDLEVRAAGIDERRQLLRARHDEIDARLGRLELERDASEARRVDLDRRLGLATRLQEQLRDDVGVIDREVETLRGIHRRQSEEVREAAQTLDRLRKDRSASERKLHDVRQVLQRAEIDRAEVDLRVETAIETLRRDHDAAPQQAMAVECPPLADGVSAGARTRELERELRLMGPINPLALEEFDALSERHEFLRSQLDDVRQSRRELNKVIRAVDEEIVNVFSSAYSDVAENFTKLFGSLFPGGHGALRLTDPSNLLDTGLEVEARPSGKNVKKLSLLSGGERSLTALAFLFAVFRSRPSPFYVMDEVEAALDDVNLHRFLSLVQEFRDEAQLMIVSHQKRTMEAADCLYGVSMKPGGSSKVLGERVAGSVDIRDHDDIVLQTPAEVAG
ncbi:MAG: chromosome segregation protein SMC [Acidimicrobiia bacterium]|nr:chromosome segregation protein SMC [Acidimicrobiia bacterium]